METEPFLPLTAGRIFSSITLKLKLWHSKEEGAKEAPAEATAKEALAEGVLKELAFAYPAEA